MAHKENQGARHLGRLAAWLVSILLAALLGFPGFALALDADGRIAIIHTNDVHCSVDASDMTVGYAGVAAAVTSAEGTYGSDGVTLVDAGDAIQGSALGSLSQGSYVVDIMNEVGYDIAVPGNHEFDYGVPRFLELVGESKATYLSCNFDDLGTGATVLDSYKIVQYGGTKVAYVGITTPESLSKVAPTRFQDGDGAFIYGFCQDDTGTALYDRIQATVDAARSAGADYVVAVAHLGQDGITSRWTSTAVVKNTTGIDVLIDGHSHESYEQTVANKDGSTQVKIAQTGTGLASYGEVVIDPTTHEITASLVKAPVSQDEEVTAFVGGIEGKISDLIDKQVATTSANLYANDWNEAGEKVAQATRLHETNLGDLVADALRTRTGTDISIVNGGGIRADIPSGDITYGDLLTTQPFGNKVCTVEATGQQILDALEVSASLYPASSGGFLQVSGMSYEIRTDIASTVSFDAEGGFVAVEGARRVQNVLVAGKPIDASATYSVASYSFILRDGGNGYSMFKAARVLSSDEGTDVGVLADYLSEDLGGNVGEPYLVAGGEGRITFKGTPDPVSPPAKTDEAGDGDEASSAEVVIMSTDGSSIPSTGDPSGAAGMLATVGSCGLLSGAAIRSSRRRPCCASARRRTRVR